jgi:hypothetical protein
LRFLVPPTASLGLAPAEAARHFRSWLRSQAFSTSQRFPGRPKLRGLVSCRNRSWDSSLQSLPLTGDRLPLSRQPGSLAVIHRRAGRTTLDLVTAGFLRLPRFHAVACSPPPAMGSLFTHRGTLPGPPGSRAVEPPVPPASPASKLHSPLRVRSRLGWVSPHQPADTLLGFSPSRAFSFHASDSRPAQA